MKNITDLWKEASTNSFQLHSNHVNASMMQVLRIIGFDKRYVRAKGMRLWDEKGTEYLDFLGGYSLFSLGHNPEELKNILKEVLNQDWPNLVQMDAPPLSGILAKELTSRDPSGRLQYAYFGNSGAEAIECAIKFARATTRRPGILAFEGGFHGLSMGALSICGDEMWKDRFGPFLPDCYTVGFGNLNELEDQLRTKKIAALIAEPIQGEGGVRELSQQQWNDIQALCKKYGTLLVLDEIQTGMGRTGKFFAFEHWNLQPDMVCLSKAFTNGMVAGSAVLGTKHVFQSVFDRLDRCVVHSSTFSENNLAMAAAWGVIQELERQGLVEKTARNGELFKEKLQRALSPYEFFKEVRGRGMMIAMQFDSPKSMGLKMAWSLIHKANKALFGQMITTALMNEHHILTQVAGHDLNVLKISPPLIITEAEMDIFANALAKVLESCQKFPGGIWDFGMGLAKRAMSKQESATL